MFDYQVLLFSETSPRFLILQHLNFGRESQILKELWNIWANFIRDLVVAGSFIPYMVILRGTDRPKMPFSQKAFRNYGSKICHRSVFGVFPKEQGYIPQNGWLISNGKPYQNGMIWGETPTPVFGNIRKTASFIFHGHQGLTGKTSVQTGVRNLGQPRGRCERLRQLKSSHDREIQGLVKQEYLVTQTNCGWTKISMFGEDPMRCPSEF